MIKMNLSEQKIDCLLIGTKIMTPKREMPAAKGHLIINANVKKFLINQNVI